MEGSTYPQAFIDRFWSKIAKAGEDECWLWTASCAGKGYGQIKPPIAYGRRNFKAHRLAYELAYGPIPENGQICHKCDVTGCCNPKHLFVGTSADNHADMVKKDRHLRGERNAKAKLTEREALRVHELIDSGLSQKAVAERFGICQMQVSRIRRGLRWRHLIKL